MRGMKRHQKAFKIQMADFIKEIGHAFYGSPTRTRTRDKVVNSNLILPFQAVSALPNHTPKNNKKH